MSGCLHKMRRFWANKAGSNFAEFALVAPFLVLGRAWLENREPDKAIGYLERLLEIDPSSEDARLSLARLSEGWDPEGRVKIPCEICVTGRVTAVALVLAQ